MKAYRLFVLTLLLSLISIASSSANGTYQRTHDREKSLVWNNDPQPGDVATWSGGRDEEGYATGPGTLTWSQGSRGFRIGSTTRKRTPISSYSGTMVHGKFNGGVMTVNRGKTYHAPFVDGQRKEKWAAGPLVPKGENAELVATKKAERKEAPTASTATATEKVAEDKKKEPVAETTLADIPAESPTEEKADVREQKAEATDSHAAESSNPSTLNSRPSTILIAQASTEEPDLSATPRQPVTREAALEPGPVRAIERPTSAVPERTQNEPVKQSTRARASKQKTEGPAKKTRPKATEAPEAETELTEDTPVVEPSAVTKEENVERSELERRSTPNAQAPIKESSQPSTFNPQPSANEKPLDDSIRTLTGPPSSLRTKTEPLPETNPPKTASKLSAVQAMDIADIEARTRGYDLDEYQLPKAEYNAANGTWSVGYVRRGSDSTAKKLSVTVQDKSGKAEVKK